MREYERGLIRRTCITSLGKACKSIFFRKEIHLQCSTKANAVLPKQLWHSRVPTQLSTQAKFSRKIHAFPATSPRHVTHEHWAICQTACTERRGTTVVTCCQYSSRDGKAEKYPVSCTIWSSWKMLHIGMTSISLPRCSHKWRRTEDETKPVMFRVELEPRLYWHV